MLEPEHEPRQWHQTVPVMFIVSPCSGEKEIILLKNVSDKTGENATFIKS